ncbi:hypothetical protein D3C85_1667590 [compost metagenome]
MHERREPGAKVIQREAHTETAESVHGLLDQIATAHHGGFCQFEFQPLRLNATLGNQPAQRRQQLTVLKLAE